MAKGRRYFYLRPTRAMQRAGIGHLALSAKNAAEALSEAEALVRRWNSSFGIENLGARPRQRDLIDHAATVTIAALKRARGRGLPVDIDQAYIEELLRQQNYCCALSGLPFEMKSRQIASFRAPFRPSIDRIERARGYVRGNCRMVLTAVNYAINEWGEDVFMRIAKAAVDKARSRNRENMRIKSARFPDDGRTGGLSV